MNSFIGIGNLTRDPVLRYTQEGTPYVKFTVAIDTSKKGEPLFLDCTAWDKQAEPVAEYLRKGSKAAVSGEIRMDRWEDNEGNKRTSWYCHVRNVEFLDPKSRNEERRMEEEAPVREDDLPF